MSAVDPSSSAGINPVLPSYEITTVLWSGTLPTLYTPFKLDSSLFDNDGEVLPETSDMPSVPNENFNEGLDSREVWFSITKGNVVSFLFGLLFGYLINHLFKGVLNSTAHSKVIRRPEL